MSFLLGRVTVVQLLHGMRGPQPDHFNDGRFNNVGTFFFLYFFSVYPSVSLALTNFAVLSRVSQQTLAGVVIDLVKTVGTILAWIWCAVIDVCGRNGHP